MIRSKPKIGFICIINSSVINEKRKKILQNVSKLFLVDRWCIRVRRTCARTQVQLTEANFGSFAPPLARARESLWAISLTSLWISFTYKLTSFSSPLQCGMAFLNLEIPLNSLLWWWISHSYDVRFGRLIYRIEGIMEKNINL